MHEPAGCLGYQLSGLTKLVVDLDGTLRLYPQAMLPPQLIDQEIAALGCIQGSCVAEFIASHGDEHLARGVTQVVQAPAEGEHNTFAIGDPDRRGAELSRLKIADRQQLRARELAG